MTPQRLPAIVTIALMAAALTYFAVRQRLPQLRQTSAAAPEDVVWRMMDGARAGDVEAYLQCFDGALKQNLEKTRAEMGEEKFGAYLKRLNDEVTGVAVSDLEQPNAGEARLRVEFVFRGRNEAQQHQFKLIGGKWKITNVDGAERINTPVPYGQEVGREQ